MDKLFGQILYSWVCKILVTKYFASKIILYSTTVTSVLVDLLDSDWGPAPSSPFCHLSKDVRPQVLCKAYPKDLEEGNANSNARNCEKIVLQPLFSSL